MRTIPDLQAAIESGLPLFRNRVAPPSLCLSPRPLIDGTASFADRWMNDWHNRYKSQDPRDVACYYAEDAVISGDGQIWLDNSLVTSVEIMPRYVARILDVDAGGSAALHSSSMLPIRIVDTPCLVATGHGIQVYGHFLIELLFRLLIARHAFFNVGRVPYLILLDFAAPRWLLQILEEDLDIGLDQIEFFFPQQERVLLRHAFIPTNIFHDDGINPFANVLIGGLLDRLNIGGLATPPRRIFVTRGNFHNPKSSLRVCVNEKNLAELAARRHGFTSITPEAMNWRKQIELFRNAEIVVGPAGSGLHNALFSQSETRLASIGNLNFVQLHIGALRELSNAFLTQSIESSGEYCVNETLFEAFLDAVCSSV